MEKDIYSIIEKRLNNAGFVCSTEYMIVKSESMDIAGKYALCDRSRPDFRSSVKHTSEVADKLEITSEELEMLLAIVKEDDDAVPDSRIASKYHRHLIKVTAVCSSLMMKGYLEGFESTTSGETSYRVTSRGLMCLLSEEPMDKLNTEAFISENEPQRKSKTLAEDVDIPFLEFLKEKINGFCEGNLPMLHLLGLADICLECSQNQRFRIAFNTVGYEKCTDEQKSFLLMLCNHFAKNGAVPMDFSLKSSPIEFSSSRFDALSLAAQGLVTAGLVVIPPVESTISNADEVVKERFMLSPDVAGEIFHGMASLINYATLCKHSEVWKSESIEPKPLLFDKEMAENVASLNILVDPEKSATLMERLKEVGRKSLTCLFYGAPGVGKTELCRQMARATGRDCIVVDPAKIDGCFWGDSEKNVREVFRAYKYLYKISEKAPILVFNEADGILSKRFSKLSRAIEKSENAVQGIILQELETFEGIFIATTNLQDNLDVASDRRFLYKLRFDYPSAEIRKQIISMKMKWLSDDDASALSKEFCLSGGQIDNVASKCVIEQFITGKEATLQRMRSFCREELSMRKEKTAPGAGIGFVRYPVKGFGR